MDKALRASGHGVPRVELMRRFVLPLVLGGIALTSSLSWAQSLKNDEVLSTIGLQVLATPEPVLGADNRIHLVYEWQATNTADLFMTLNKVSAVDETGRDVGSLSGEKLAAMMAVPGGHGTTLAPGGSAFIFMDTAFPAGARLPRTLAARIGVTRQLAGPGGKPIPYPANSPLPATVVFLGPAVTVGIQAAVVVDPPLRGAGWLAANGCCDAVSSHRGAIMAVNGVQRAAQRFAIDWLQMTPDKRMFLGNKTTLENYPSFGAPVYAVADGVVVNLYDQAAEQVPGKVAGITPKDIGGNMLVIDIGGGRYGFFAHLKPGSLRVKLGDHVTRGQVIAQLGSTGNSDAPHLHFHVMDGPSPLNANGLPYVFSHFSVRGVADGDSVDGAVGTGKPLLMTTRSLDGPHARQLPLNLEVIDFSP